MLGNELIDDLIEPILHMTRSMLCKVRLIR